MHISKFPLEISTACPFSFVKYFPISCAIRLQVGPRSCKIARCRTRPRIRYRSIAWTDTTEDCRRVSLWKYWNCRRCGLSWTSPPTRPRRRFLRTHWIRGWATGLCCTPSTPREEATPQPSTPSPSRVSPNYRVSSANII